MEEKTFSRLRDWVEPAHPMVVKLRDELYAILAHVREKYQSKIDQAFDRVSRQIGFVVTTTLPIILEIGKGGDVKSISMGAEHLKDTLFERELKAALKELTGDSIKNVSAGTFNLYLLWYDALKLKLRTDWMEPAHVIRERIGPRIRAELAEGPERLRWEVREPAHWFDPGTAIAVEEAVLISVIDEVYPDLRLVDRIASWRRILRRRVRPEVMEPAHFFGIEECERQKSPEDVLRKIRSMLDWI